MEVPMAISEPFIGRTVGLDEDDAPAWYRAVCDDEFVRNNDTFDIDIANVLIQPT